MYARTKSSATYEQEAGRKMAETSFDDHVGRQIVIPWWPTPVPRLPQRSV